MRCPYTWAQDTCEWQLTQCGLVNLSVTATLLYMATRLNEVVPVAQHGVPSSYNWNAYPGQVSLVLVTLACAGTTEDSTALDEATSTAWSVV